MILAGPKRPPASLANTNGPKAEPNAIQANSTLLKIVAGIISAISMDTTTTKAIVNLDISSSRPG